MMEKKELNKASLDLAKRLESELKALVPVKTGRLRRSIKAVVSDSGDISDIIIEGESYIRFLAVERGRKMTAKPSYLDGKRVGGLLSQFENGTLDRELASNSIENAYANDVEQAILKAIDRIFNR